MADPQHPAVPFEQAVDLLTGEPRPLRPQHPDIAAPTLAQMPALIAKHDEFAALAAEHGHEEMAALHAVTAAALRTLTRPEEVRPIPMILFCPACGEQHIDEPDERTPGWTNPPHKSHLCHGCGHVWRPCDLPTEGVRAIKTRGKADSEPVTPARRLAREKASAEQELQTERDAAAILGAELSRAEERATRAEQERYAARQNAVTAAEALHTLGLAHVEQGREIARLREALRKFGFHRANCAVYQRGDEQPCNCGYERALAAAAGAEEPR